MQGYPAQAVERVGEFVDGARKMDHPASVTVLLAWAASIFFWTGDVASAEEHIEASLAIAESYSLGPLAAVGRARKAQLAIRFGNAGNGVAQLRASLAEIHAVRYELITTEFKISLAQGLTARGQHDEAMSLIDGAIEHVGSNGDTCYMPELLRVRAGLLQSKARPFDEVEACLMHALELSRSQGARSWELRTASDLAVLLSGKRRPQDVTAVLQRAYGQFTEGFDTADLRTAKRLLKELA
jgi:predicted ATPase